MKKRPLARIKIKLQSYILSFKKVENPNKFVIYAQGRTGSTLLRDLLNSHPDIYCAYELFHKWRSLFEGRVWFPYRYLRGIEVLHHQYVFGFKVKIYQLINDQKLDPGDFLDRLEARGYQIIYLHRSNTLEHALSSIIRHRRNSPSLKKGDKYDEKPFEVPIDVIEEKLNSRLNHKKTEFKYLEGRKYFEVNYEKHLKDGKEHQNICNQLFDYLGLVPVEVKTQFQKINKKSPSEVILNYEELSAHFKNTPFGKFF